jgi:hypothetical protein
MVQAAGPRGRWDRPWTRRIAVALAQRPGLPGPVGHRQWSAPGPPSPRHYASSRVTGGRAARAPYGNQGRHESTLLSRQPWRGHECRWLCTGLVDELCKSAGLAVRCQGRAWTDRGRPPPVTSINADVPMGCGKFRTGSRPGRRPDSYPHVTCECAVTEQCNWAGCTTRQPGNSQSRRPETSTCGSVPGHRRVDGRDGVGPP